MTSFLNQFLNCVFKAITSKSDLFILKITKEIKFWRQVTLGKEEWGWVGPYPGQNDEEMLLNYEALVVGISTVSLGHHCWFEFPNRVHIKVKSIDQVLSFQSQLGIEFLIHWIEGETFFHNATECFDMMLEDKPSCKQSWVDSCCVLDYQSQSILEIKLQEVYSWILGEGVESSYICLHNSDHDVGKSSSHFDIFIGWVSDSIFLWLNIFVHLCLKTFLLEFFQVSQKFSGEEEDQILLCATQLSHLQQLHQVLHSFVCMLD